MFPKTDLKELLAETALAIVLFAAVTSWANGWISGKELLFVGALVILGIVYLVIRARLEKGKLPKEIEEMLEDERRRDSR